MQHAAVEREVTATREGCDRVPWPEFVPVHNDSFVSVECARPPAAREASLSATSYRFLPGISGRKVKCGAGNKHWVPAVSSDLTLCAGIGSRQQERHGPPPSGPHQLDPPCAGHQRPSRGGREEIPTRVLELLMACQSSPWCGGRSALRALGRTVAVVACQPLPTSSPARGVCGQHPPSPRRWDHALRASVVDTEVNRQLSMRYGPARRRPWRHHRRDREGLSGHMRSSPWRR